MSNARKITRLVGLMVLMAFAFTALTSSATAATKKQKSLLKQVKKNPSIVKNKKFIKKAAAANFELPVTVRFNRCLAGNGITGQCLAWGAANDTINIDLGQTLGNTNVDQTAEIVGGVIQLWATFADPRDGDTPGNLRLSNVSLAGPALTSNLTLSGIEVLENADITGAPVSFIEGGAQAASGQINAVGTNGCSDVATAQYGITYQMAQGVGLLGMPGWAATTTNYGGRDTADAPGDIPGSISSRPLASQDVVFRTAPILAAVNSAIGDANLFNGNVDLTVNTTVTVNSVFRELDNESPMHCMEALTAASVSPNVSIRAQDTNGLEIDPAITKDGKLRLANVNLGQGPISRPEIQACLAPIYPYAVQVTGMIGTAIDLMSAPINTGLGGTVGVEDIPDTAAIDLAAGGNGTGSVATTSDFRTSNGANAAVTCASVPLPAQTVTNTAGTQFNPLYAKVAPMLITANHVELRPDVSLGSITAEGLIGHFGA